MQSGKNYINPDDFERIIQAIPELHLRKWSVQQIQMLFKISYFCALRITEAIKLEKSDFNIEQFEVFLGKTKNEDRAHASIPEYFVRELQIYLNFCTEEELFAGLSRYRVHRWTKKLGVMLQLEAWIIPQSKSKEKTKTHIFRKSFGKDLLWGTHTNKPAPLNIVQAKLRHRDIKVTSGYLNVGLDEVKLYEKITP